MAEKEREKMARRMRRVKTGDQNIIVVRYYSIVQQVLMRIRLSREGRLDDSNSRGDGTALSYGFLCGCHSLPFPTIAPSPRMLKHNPKLF